MTNRKMPWENPEWIKPDRGELHPHAKLTWEKIDDIRSSKECQRRIAKKYGVCLSTIQQIRLYRTWKPETKPLPPVMRIHFCYYRNERHFSDVMLASLMTAHTNAKLEVILHEDTPGDSSAYIEARTLPYIRFEKTTLTRTELIATIPKGEIFAEPDFLFLKPFAEAFTITPDRQEIKCEGPLQLKKKQFYPITKTDKKFSTGYDYDLSDVYAVYLWSMDSVADLAATCLKSYIPPELLRPTVRLLDGITVSFD